jgi:hypothetical protein
LFVAAAVHLEDTFVVLSLLALILILAINVTHLGVTADELVADVDLRAGSYTAAVVVLVYEDATLRQVKLGLADLLLSRHVRVESKPLGHLANDGLAFVLIAQVVIVEDGQILFLFGCPVRIECHAAIHETVLAALVAFEGLAAYLLLAVDQSVLVAMVVEVDLAQTAIDLYHLLPVVRGGRAFIVLHEFELVGESPPEDQVVLAILVEGADLRYDKTLEVLIDSYALNYSVNLRALGVEVDLALLVEDSLFAVRTQVDKLIFIDEELRTPRRWHVQDIILLLGATTFGVL